MARVDERLVQGALLMSAGFILMACFGALLKETTVLSSPFFAIWVAYATAMFIQFCLTIPRGIRFYKTRRIGTHFLRGFFGVFATFLYIIAMKHIILMNATLLFTTTPLFIPIIATLFLRVTISWKIWLAIVVGFVGVTIIIKPTASIFEEVWSFIGLASGLALAIAYIYVKLLTVTEPPGRINFYFFFFGTLLITPWMLFEGTMPSLLAIGCGMAAGLVYTLTQFLVVKAYQATDPSSIGPFQYISVVAAGFLDWLFWHRVPEWDDYVGALLVMVGGILVISLFANRR